MNYQKFRRFTWWCYAAGLLTIFLFSREAGGEVTGQINEKHFDRMMLIVIPSYAICAILGGLGIILDLVRKKGRDGLNDFILLGSFLLLGFCAVAV